MERGEQLTRDEKDRLAHQYLALAEAERKHFEDDSYDSDITAALATRGMIEARRRYDAYVAKANEIWRS